MTGRTTFGQAAHLEGWIRLVSFVVDWTRKPGTRVIALLASIALLVTYWHDRGLWFWIGLGLLLINTMGLVATRRGGYGVYPVPGRPLPDPRANRALPDDGERSTPGGEVLLAELDIPEVESAFRQGPDSWHQVSHLEDHQLDPVPWSYIAEHTWLELDEHWSLAVDDEVKPYLDLDLDPEDDPCLAVLRGHPAVADAWHEDREVYAIEQRAPMTVREFGELAARALVAHQQYVSGRAS